MSLRTLRADVRYQDCQRMLRDQVRDLDIANPAFADGRVTARAEEITARMVALAVEHGWNAEQMEWER
jgi:hypothetical protein